MQTKTRQTRAPEPKGEHRTRAQLLDEIQELKQTLRRTERYLVAAWRLKEMYKAAAAGVAPACGCDVKATDGHQTRTCPRRKVQP